MLVHGHRSIPLCNKVALILSCDVCFYSFIIFYTIILSTFNLALSIKVFIKRFKMGFIHNINSLLYGLHTKYSFNFYKMQ